MALKPRNTQAIAILDEWIGCLVEVSNKGYAQFDFLRLNMMTLAALFRNAAAYKLSRSALRKIHLPSAAVKGEEEYRREAFLAVSLIRKGYDTLNQSHIAYNKIDGMFNLMNCACVYAGFGEREMAVRLLDEILSYYKPDNPQEQEVYHLICRKRDELSQIHLH